MTDRTTCGSDQEDAEKPLPAAEFLNNHSEDPKEEHIAHEVTPIGMEKCGGNSREEFLQDVAGGFAGFEGMPSGDDIVRHHHPVSKSHRPVEETHQSDRRDQD